MKLVSIVAIENCKELSLFFIEKKKEKKESETK